MENSDYRPLLHHFPSYHPGKKKNARSGLSNLRNVIDRLIGSEKLCM